jgi:hypothetical protein
VASNIYLALPPVWDRGDRIPDIFVPATEPADRPYLDLVGETAPEMRDQ